MTDQSFEAFQQPPVEESAKAAQRIPLPPQSPFNRALLLLVAFRITRSIAAGMMIVALPYLVLHTLHDTSLTLGILYVVGVLSTALLAVAAGQLADRWSQKGALIITGFMVPASALIVYGNQSLPMLMVAAVMGGFAATGSLIGGGIGGAGQPVQSAIIARISTPDNRTRYYSVLDFLNGIAGAGGALLVPCFSVQNTFLVAGLISLAGAAATLVITLPAAPPTPTVTRRQSQQAIRHFSITGALNGLSQGLITPFLIPFFVMVYHTPKASMAVYTAIGSILGAVALLTAPALERRLGFVRSVTFTRAMGTLLLLIMAFWHNLEVGLIIYLLTPALRIAALPAQQTALISRVEGNSMGRALAANQVTRLSAASGAMLCTGYLFDISAIESPFILYAGVMAVNIYLYYRFFGRHGFKAAQPDAIPIEETAADAQEENGTAV